MTIQKLNTQIQLALQKLLLPLPSSYLAECSFSAVNDFLLKNINRLDLIN